MDVRSTFNEQKRAKVPVIVDSIILRNGFHVLKTLLLLI